MKKVPASLFQALISTHFLSVKVGLRWTEGNSRLSDGIEVNSESADVAGARGSWILTPFHD